VSGCPFCAKAPTALIAAKGQKITGRRLACASRTHEVMVSGPTLKKAVDRWNDQAITLGLPYKVSEARK